VKVAFGTAQERYRIVGTEFFLPAIDNTFPFQRGKMKKTPDGLHTGLSTRYNLF
jgi:hypothetical protein